MQVCVQAREVQRPLDDRLRAGDDESLPAPGQTFVCPDQDRQAGAVDEVKAGQIHHKERRVVLQGAADGASQMVAVGRVKVALQSQH